MANLRREEQELARILSKLSKSFEVLEESAKQTAREQGKTLLSKGPSGIGANFRQGLGVDAFKSRVKGAGGGAGFASQLAGRSLVKGGLVGLAASAVGAGVSAAKQAATVALTAAGRGQDASSAVTLEFQKGLAKVPFFGAKAEKAVAVTEGQIGDLNSLTGNLAALGYDTDRIRRQAAPILREQQKRRYDDQVKNRDVAQQANEGEFFSGISRTLHELFGDANINGAK